MEDVEEDATPTDVQGTHFGVGFPILYQKFNYCEGEICQVTLKKV